MWELINQSKRIIQGCIFLLQCSVGIRLLYVLPFALPLRIQENRPQSSTSFLLRTLQITVRNQRKKTEQTWTDNKRVWDAGFISWRSRRSVRKLVNSLKSSSPLLLSSAFYKKLIIHCNRKNNCTLNFASKRLSFSWIFSFLKRLLISPLSNLPDLSLSATCHSERTYIIASKDYKAHSSLVLHNFEGYSAI